jgi:hypothetical protein
MKKNEIINVLQKEIDWCEGNKFNKDGIERLEQNGDFSDGFVGGLKQAIFIIKQIYETSKI